MKYMKKSVSSCLVNGSMRGMMFREPLVCLALTLRYKNILASNFSKIQKFWVVYNGTASDIYLTEAVKKKFLQEGG